MPGILIGWHLTNPQVVGKRTIRERSSDPAATCLPCDAGLLMSCRSWRMSPDHRDRTRTASTPPPRMAVPSRSPPWPTLGQPPWPSSPRCCPLALARAAVSPPGQAATTPRARGSALEGRLFLRGPLPERPEACLEALLDFRTDFEVFVPGQLAVTQSGKCRCVEDGQESPVGERPGVFQREGTESRQVWRPKENLDGLVPVVLAVKPDGQLLEMTKPRRSCQSADAVQRRDGLRTVGMLSRFRPAG